MSSINAGRTDSPDNSSHLVQLSKDYTDFLQAGDVRQAESVFMKMHELNHLPGSEQDNSLYHEIGKLTRELHESINNFFGDSRIQLMTDTEMPDARQRLQHVIELTERSAHRTISLIEHSGPLMSSLDERASVLRDKLQVMATGKDRTSLDDLQLEKFLEMVSSTSEKVSEDLNMILLAQDYQDLTGQIIQRVSTLVQEVENKLLTLLKISEDSEGHGSVAICKESQEGESGREKDNRGYGPAVPGMNKEDVLQSQEEVDDLLSSLGF